MTKERLKAYRDMKREKDHLEQKIKTLEWEKYSPRSPRLDGMPRSGFGENYAREEQIDREDKLLALLSAKKAALSEAMAEIERAIEKLKPRERLLLRLYYIDGLTWEQVAVNMNYSWTQVHRIHGRALQKLKEEEAANV